MHSQKQILLMIVLAALVMRGPINAVGPMAPVVRDVFDLPWEAFGVLAGIPTMAFGLCSLAVLPLVAGFGSRTFAVAALTGAALGSFVRCIEWMPALFLGTLILSVSIAGLNVWVPSVIKVVFHDRQSQVMGVYTAVLSISGLLGTASVMPALEAGGGNYGCQITTEIDQYPHPGNFQLTQFRQHIILRQILQTICWHESISI